MRGHDCSPSGCREDGAGDGVDADDGRRLGGVPPGDGVGPGRRPPRSGARLLRVPGRDAALLGRPWRAGARARRRGDRRAVRGDLRPGRGVRPDHRGAAGEHPPPRPGASGLGPQVGGRAGRDRPGRGHAPHHGRRTPRHPRLPRRDHDAVRRTPGQAQRAHAHRGPHLRRDPPRHLPRRRSLPPRPRAGGQRGPHGRRGRWVEGGGHGAVARAPARRHHGRAHGVSRQGDRAGLRHRPRPRSLRAAGPLGHRRRARRGHGGALQARRRDRSGDATRRR